MHQTQGISALEQAYSPSLKRILKGALRGVPKETLEETLKETLKGSPRKPKKES